MDLELYQRIIAVVSKLLQIRIDLDSDDDMNDIIDIIFKSIEVAYHKNDPSALEKILDSAEALTEAL